MGSSFYSFCPSLLLFLGVSGSFVFALVGTLSGGCKFYFDFSFFLENRFFRKWDAANGIQGCPLERTFRHLHSSKIAVQIGVKIRL